MATSESLFASAKAQLVVPGADQAAEFYKAAFGAVELRRSSEGKEVCIELKIGNATFLVCDQAATGACCKGNGTGGCGLYLETEDFWGAVERAVKAGAVLEEEVAKGVGGVCGGRCVGKLKDPSGAVWVLASVGTTCCA